MNAFRRVVFVLAIPLNVLAAVWILAGSNLWPPVDSTAPNLMNFVVGPVLVVGLSATTILMFGPREHIRITTAQAWLQTMLWTALFVLGLTFPALEDNHGGASILLRVIDQDPLTSALSGLLWTLSVFVAWRTG